MSQWEGSYYLHQGNQLKCLAMHVLNNLNLRQFREAVVYHMNGVFQISRLFYLCLPLHLLCDRRRAPKSYDWIKKIAQCETLLFPQTWDKHVKAELRANQRRTEMNLLPFFSTETWALILLFVALLLAWVKHSLLILCSCHFSLLAIAHFHITNLLKSGCDFQFSSI